MRLELSRRAQADLAEIRDYSVERYGTQRAIAYIDAIEQAFRRIVDHPQTGAVRSDLGDVRSVPSGEHRVFYEVAVDTIVVLRVLHKAMDVGRHL